MGVKQAFYLLAFVEGITIPVFLTALVGIYLLWRGPGRALAVFVTILALFPIAFLTLISVRTPVSTYYLLPTVPIFFMGAGYFLDRVFAVEWAVRPRWLVPVTVAILVLIPGTPTLISQYLNGRRYDFKSAARWLEPRLTPDDVIFSDQPVVMEHYLPKVEIARLRYNTAPLDTSMHAAQTANSGGALWIVAPAPAHALRTNLRQGGLAAWIYAHCQLRNSIGHGRVDFRQQYLQVYRCPPEPAADAGTPQARPPAAGSTSPG
jgi:hypothetical protein